MSDNLPAAVVKPLYAHVLMDRSGSMAAIHHGAVTAYNEYCMGLVNIDVAISLSLFDSGGIDMVRNRCKPVEAMLKVEDFQPRASTPLYDAIGTTVGRIRHSARDGERIALVILTDGQENSSREYTADAVKALIKQCETDGWLVIYLGANQDAFAQGSKFGATVHNTMNFNPASARSSMSSAARYTRTYSTSGQANTGFLDSERSDAMKGKNNT